MNFRRRPHRRPPRTRYSPSSRRRRPCGRACWPGGGATLIWRSAPGLRIVRAAGDRREAPWFRPPPPAPPRGLGAPLSTPASFPWIRGMFWALCPVNGLLSLALVGLVRRSGLALGLPPPSDTPPLRTPRFASAGCRWSFACRLPSLI